MEHLQSVERQTGETPKKLLEAPELSEEAFYYWGLFVDISSGREQSMSGAAPLSWQNILAWCTLYCVKLSNWELDTIKRLDRIWSKHVSKGDK
jgi:hypothetical protein